MNETKDKIYVKRPIGERGEKHQRKKKGMGRGGKVQIDEELRNGSRKKKKKTS